MQRHTQRVLEDVFSDSRQNPRVHARSSVSIFLLALAISLASLVTPPVRHAQALPYTPPGDTLTVIMRPLLNIPAIVLAGDTLELDCMASSSTTDWAVSLTYRELTYPLTVVNTEYVTSISRWSIKALVSPEIPDELYDIVVTASGGISDTSENAVQVIESFPSDFYLVHVTDPHLPTHLFYEEPGSETDSSEMVDLREVIKDVNLINPSFVLLTGDLVNEGELEDFEYRRYFTRAQRILTEFEVPVYLVTGNHDVGGWDATPPPDGEARRTWWKFFGWPYLDNPPTGVSRTQDYSFDYGVCHFVGMEAYINYDNWRYEIYGSQSFTDEQMDWLPADLAAASGSQLQILFHHYDFSSELDLASLGIDLSLYGHIHRNEGSLTGWPLNIATDNCCDGARSYRVVRFSGSTITPSTTISAGSSGTKLTITFSPSNDGSASNASASIVNTQTQGFENAMVRFYMKQGYTYSVTNGTLVQTVESDSVLICYVGVDIDPSSSVTVYVDGVAGVEESVPSVIAATACFPNPFQSATSIQFSLVQPSHVKLSIFDTRGRLVKQIAEVELPAGTHGYAWDGRDASGRPVAAGIYLYEMDANGAKVARKVLVLR